ncbi:MGH1-like glycoside hydrolase domain-containing protein [Micromonospora fulviviridis]|uniref:PA14 domain-containing protein n=1 Tax=Micromonospora fulviviridis TaxID=47860 RepID=A0ABV2VR94_9ACTN
MRQIRLVAVVAAVLTAAATAAPGAAAPPQGPPPPVAASPYPTVGAGTHFLDHRRYLTGYAEPAWYEANIPFVDLPDQQIQDVYYYRWRVWKEHLRYAGPTDGWVLTEFLDCCGYAAPYQAINAAAGHHVTEGRWVRDRGYLNDYLTFWLTGPGQRPQTVNPEAPDWAHEYSFWAATAAYQRAQVTGDFAFLQRLQDALIAQYRDWDNHFDPELGLYWQRPVWDAKELSPASYASSDHFGGVHTFRPSINAYQYGDALAISAIARRNGDEKVAAEYAGRAVALKANAHRWLWDPAAKFWLDIVDENNPTHERQQVRTEVGFIPWQFGLAEPADSVAWRQLLDPQGFASAYGPTTVERRSPYFMSEAAQGCCHWDGPSWPYSTSQALTGLANLLDDQPAQTDIGRDDYYALLRTYALTQYRDGRPYVAEAHHPDEKRWIYDGHSHSEDYLHSSYTDLVISGLLGLRPQDGGTLKLKPLVPDAWDHYAIENVPYHGHNVTVLWDRDGSHYGQGAGLRVYVDGALRTMAAEPGALTVPIGATVPAPQTVRLVNDAANSLRTGYPKPIASYTSPYDNPWNALDGKVWFNEVPQNTRWTNYRSPNAQDWYGVDFGGPTRVQDVRWYGYDDGGGVQAAADYRLQYWTDGAWVDVAEQRRSSQQPVGNGLNRITFPPLTTDRIRLLFTNPVGAFVGVNELQAWSTSSAAAGFVVGDGGHVSVRPGQATTVTTTFTNRSDRPAEDVSVSLAAPSGWTVTPLDAVLTRRVPPAGTITSRWSVRPADGVAPCDDAALTGEAVYTVGGVRQPTHARATVEVGYDPAQRRGLRGDYHVSTGPGAFDFGALKSSAVDPNLDFDDLEPVLRQHTGQSDDVTVRWTGSIVPRYSETYTFSMIGDNGFRLWVDGQLLIDNWTDNWDVERTAAPITLRAGTSYDIKVEYFEHYGGSNLHLRWQSPSQPKGAVETCALYPPAE